MSTDLVNPNSKQPKDKGQRRCPVPQAVWSSPLHPEPHLDWMVQSTGGRLIEVEAQLDCNVNCQMDRRSQGQSQQTTEGWFIYFKKTCREMVAADCSWSRLQAKAYSAFVAPLKLGIQAKGWHSCDPGKHAVDEEGFPTMCILWPAATKERSQEELHHILGSSCSFS